MKIYILTSAADEEDLLGISAPRFFNTLEEAMEVLYSELDEIRDRIPDAEIRFLADSPETTAVEASAGAWRAGWRVDALDLRVAGRTE